MNKEEPHREKTTSNASAGEGESPVEELQRMVDEAREEADRNSTQSFFKTRERGYDIYMYVVLGVLILLVLFLKFLY